MLLATGAYTHFSWTLAVIGKSMNKTLNSIIWIILLVSLESVNAQEKGNHLEPVGGIYDIYDFQFEYYSKVRKVLFDGLTDSPEIRFQVMPSFTPENVLDIEFDRDNEKYFIVYNICEKMIWYNENWEKVKVKKYRTEIDKKPVETIKSLFDIVISQTKFPEEETMGLDGANYYFSINKFGLKSGTIWSPSEGTKMRRLVKIGFSLVEIAKSNKPIVGLDDKLKMEIESLINELK